MTPSTGAVTAGCSVRRKSEGAKTRGACTSEGESDVRISWSVNPVDGGTGKCVSNCRDGRRRADKTGSEGEELWIGNS